MAKTFKVVFKTVMYNSTYIEAESEEQARELAEDEIGEIDPLDGEVDEQEVVDVREA